jgi:hypothetical protein
MRGAKHGKDGALFTLVVRLTPFAAAPQSFPSPRQPPPSITNLRAVPVVTDKVSVFGK